MSYNLKIVVDKYYNPTVTFVGIYGTETTLDKSQIRTTLKKAMPSGGFTRGIKEAENSSVAGAFDTLFYVIKPFICYKYLSEIIKNIWNRKIEADRKAFPKLNQINRLSLEAEFFVSGLKVPYFEITGDERSQAIGLTNCLSYIAKNFMDYEVSSVFGGNAEDVEKDATSLLDACNKALKKLAQPNGMVAETTTHVVPEYNLEIEVDEDNNPTVTFVKKDGTVIKLTPYEIRTTLEGAVTAIKTKHEDHTKYVTPVVIAFDTLFWVITPFLCYNI